jgi:hypothetical protein
MPSWSYLNTYLSSIPSSQRQRLLNTLFGDINTGELSTLGEYEARLATGLQSLETTIGTPSFKLKKAIQNGLTSSANFNDMESKAIGDLKSLYTEAALLGQLASDHNQITEANLSSIIAAIGRMERKIDVLEILSANTDGYVSSSFNSFEEDNTNRLERYQTLNNEPFIVDGPGYLSEEYDAVVENEALHLPVDKAIAYRLDSAEIQNQVPPGITTLSSGIYLEEEAPYALGKLIDNDKTTYWAETVDVNGAVPVTPATTDLIVTLLGVQQLSRIIIDPFARHPYKITNISYKKNKLSTSDFTSIDSLTYPILLTSKTLIEFSTIYAEQLKFGIEQDNFSLLRYMTNSSNDTITRLFDLSTGQELDIDSSVGTPDSVYFAMSTNMKRALGINKSLLSESEIVDTYEYLYGIKTLELSQLQYKSNGIYVSDPLAVEKLGAIGLETNQTSTELTPIEYDVLISLSDTDGTSETLIPQPILPAGESVDSEILDCSYSTPYWVATTRFGVDDLTSIVVKMNSSLLTETTHYNLVQDPTTKKVTVQIIGDNLGWPTVRTSNFTVSYEPVIESYVVETERFDNAIINLRIFMRSIDPNKLLTPSVRSYSLKYKKYSS